MIRSYSKRCDRDIPMKTSISSSLALLTLAALAALSGCGSPSKLAEPAAAPPVPTRSPVAVTPAAAAPAAQPSATPQSRIATVDLARPPAAGGETAAPLPRAAAGTSAPPALPAQPALPALQVAPGERVVYFDFDSYVIKDEFKGLIDGHAKALSASAGKHIVVEGHTDERGGREYNLALGQKRAEAVLHSLTLLGVADKQLEAVSFGEERPVDPGHDEAAWARNRRAELKDR
jgi:peptidoglycan-associated lipoprotein